LSLRGDTDAEAGHGRERGVAQPGEQRAQQEHASERAHPTLRAGARDVEHVLGQREAQTDHAAVDRAVERPIELAQHRRRKAPQEQEAEPLGRLLDERRDERRGRRLDQPVLGPRSERSADGVFADGVADEGRQRRHHGAPEERHRE